LKLLDDRGDSAKERCSSQLPFIARDKRMLGRATLLRLGRAACRPSGRSSSTSTSSNAAAEVATKSAAAASSALPARVRVEACKKNIPQSPWKMNFLVKLVRGRWVPDALAQLKFSPKRRCDEVMKVVQRAVSIANLTHQAIPEELMVKEIFITKGFAQKRSRIMGRGRTGIGYRRSSHLTVRVEKIDFKEAAESAVSANQKNKWEERKKLVDDILAGRSESMVVAKRNTRV